MSEVLYTTGITDQGQVLTGGIWRLYRQEGFPIDLTLLMLREKGICPDILEMLAEATMHGELYSLYKQCPEVITDEIKIKFFCMLKNNGAEEIGFEAAAEKILNDKRSKSLFVRTHCPANETPWEGKDVWVDAGTVLLEENYIL